MNQDRPDRPEETVQRIEPARIDSPPEQVADLVAELSASSAKPKHYHYQFVFARNAGHTDRTVKAQTLPEALEWVWKGFQSKR